MKKEWKVVEKYYLQEIYLIIVKDLKQKKEALRFIETNEGINYVDIDDTHFQIDYEEPIPYLWDAINYKQDIYHKDDYIIRYSTGRIEILSKKEFESLFKEVGD